VRRLAAVLLLATVAPAVAGEGPPPADRFPGAARSYLVEVAGRALWAREPDAPRLPASLTKIMTALLALEGGGSPEAWIPVSARAARETGTRLGLRAGERIRAGDALAATLVASSNDACLALAEHVAGSVEAFVERMNRRASSLGLPSTSFENPCGHDAPGQRSSARDLLRLTRVALRLPEFRRLVALPEVTVVTRAGRKLQGRSGNALLGRLDGVAGVKSGFTPGAGKCLVALVERDGVEVLAVLLGAEGRWWAASALLEEALAEAGKGG
jgi:serine-type D-Ala-D-Ala carboxypeptidase (penicillin-binding protein 5/6)